MALGPDGTSPAVAARVPNVGVWLSWRVPAVPPPKLLGTNTDAFGLKENVEACRDAGRSTLAAVVSELTLLAMGPTVAGLSTAGPPAMTAVRHLHWRCKRGLVQGAPSPGPMPDPSDAGFVEEGPEAAA